MTEQQTTNQPAAPDPAEQQRKNAAEAEARRIAEAIQGAQQGYRAFRSSLSMDQRIILLEEALDAVLERVAHIAEERLAGSKLDAGFSSAAAQGVPEGQSHSEAEKNADTAQEVLDQAPAYTGTSGIGG